jgi:hypothetical protein
MSDIRSSFVGKRIELKAGMTSLLFCKSQSKFVESLDSSFLFFLSKCCQLSFFNGNGSLANVTKSIRSHHARSSIMKLLITILSLMSMTAGAAIKAPLNMAVLATATQIPYSRPQRDIRIYCVTNGSKTSLMNDRNQVLQDFTFASDCNEALTTRRGDMICASDVTKNSMSNVRFGISVKEFTFKSDCMSALQNQKDGFVCAADGANGVDLMSLYRVQTIRHFTFAADCQSALEEVASGLICVNEIGSSTLIADDGREIQHFNFASDCEETRRNMLGGG